MIKLKPGFLTDKLFIAGFITGLFVTLAVTLLIIALNQPSPGDKTVRGTLLQWSPSVGDIGYIKWTGDSDSCGRFIGVSFYKDATGSLIICRPQGKVISGSEVQVTRIVEGKPCGNPTAGIWVGPGKSDKIQIPK